MDFSGLQTRVKDRLLLVAGDQAIGAPNTGAVAQLVNEAIHWCETAAPNGWDWLETDVSFPTVAGQRSYAFDGAAGVAQSATTLLAKIKELYINPTGSAADVPLPRFSRSELRAAYPEQAQQQPQAWAEEGRSVKLYPLPNGVYTITGSAVRQELDLVNGADVPIMPAMFHTSIVECATMLFYRRVQDPAAAAVAEAALAGWVNRMRSYGRATVGPGRVQASLESR